MSGMLTASMSLLSSCLALQAACAEDQLESDLLDKCKLHRRCFPAADNRGGFHKGASRGSRGAGGPGPRRARFPRFPGFLAVLGPIRHARRILRCVATRQLNMSPWRPFPTPFVPETVVLGCPGLPSGRSTGPNVAVAHINRPQCGCCTHQQALLCCCTTATALVWLPHTPCVASTQRQVCGCGYGAGPGPVRAARGKVWGRGVTHTHPRSLPRAAGGQA